MFFYYTDRWQRSQGALLTQSIKDGVTVEAVRDNWEKIVDMESGDYPGTNQEATMDLVGKMSSLSVEESLRKSPFDANGPFDPVILNHL
jgi:hypothetical protein